MTGKLRVIGGAGAVASAAHNAEVLDEGKRGVGAVAERIEHAEILDDGKGVFDRDAPADARPRRGADPVRRHRELARLPLTDLGNAERFARRYADAFMWVPERGWLRWDGRRWALDGDEPVMRAAHATVRAIQDEAAAIRGTEDDVEIDRDKNDEPVMLSTKLAKWGRSSEAAAKLAAIPKHAAPMLSRAGAELDADPWKINVRNGTLHVHPDALDDTVQFLPHNPADLITKVAGCDYNPAATCPRYDAFLAQVQPAEDLRRFLHHWGGYSLTGDTGEQKLVFFHGEGKNGKSTLVDVWGEIAGDYGETLPIETFLDQGRGRNAGAATPDLALLPGVRYLRTSEPEKKAKLAESFIKLVTGGEPIQARHLMRNFFRFRPEFKLTMSGNHRPVITGTDEGIWRRMVLVPWSVNLDLRKLDRTLPAALKREAPGILNRLLDGLRGYLTAIDGRPGLVLPDAVTEATERYREDSDPLGRFLAVAVVKAPGERVRSSTLHEVFSAWARASSEAVWTAKGLSLAMKDRGWRSIRSDGMWWADMRLVASALDFGDVPPAPPYGEGDDDD